MIHFRASTRTPALAAVAVVSAAAALAGCASAASTPAGTASSPAASSPAAAAGSSFPVTMTASNGSVTIKARPVRIVSLAPTATEDLYAVGAGPQVVAVDQNSDYPPGVPVTKLSGLTPNLEAIARYRPDLVISYQNANGLVAGLGKLGIPVLIEPAAATLADAYAQIDQIGQASGHLTQARRVVATMKAQIAGYVRQAGPSHPGLTYYWELTANPFYSVTSSTFIGQIVGLFGLKSIADAADKASDGGYPGAVRGVHRQGPAADHLPGRQPGRGRRPDPGRRGQARPGWPAIPAVQDHEVIGLNDDIASRWGPRLPQLVAEIAQAVERASVG